MTTLATRTTLINLKGLDSLSAFTQLNGDTDVTEIAKRMACRPSTVRRVILGTMHIKRIHALVLWVKEDHDKRGLVAEPELWDMNAMGEAMERKEAKHNYGKVDVGIIDPGKCRVNHGCWDNWQIAFTNKLNTPLGTAQVPIDYVICVPIEDRDDELFLTNEEERHYQMPLEGQNFKHYSRLVYKKMLKTACVDTNT